MKQIISFIIALVMIVSLFPAMVFTSFAEDALPTGTLLMRTEGIDQGWRTAEAGAKISFLGDGGIDAGNKTVLSGVHSTTNGRYGSEGGQTWMRSNNIWAYGYAVEIKDATGPVVAKIHPYVWTEDEAHTGAWMQNSADADHTITLPGNGVYPLLLNGACMYSGANQERYIISWAAEFDVTFNKNVKYRVLSEVEVAGGFSDISTIKADVPYSYVDADSVTKSAAVNVARGYGRDGLKGGVYTATAIAPEALDSIVIGNKKKVFVGWSTDEEFKEVVEDDVYLLGASGLNDTLYSVWNTVPIVSEPAQSEYYYDLGADPQRIPKVSEGLNGVTLWEGDNVTFGSDGAPIVTFVIKATGIKKPVSLSRLMPTFTMQNGIDYYAFNSTWGGGNTGLDGVGTEHSIALNIPRDGTYVISLGRKVFGMASAGNVLTVSKLRVADINSAYQNAYPLVNDNENAQISLLSISKGNPKFTAYFYDEDGNKIGEATKEYPKAQEANDPQTTKKTTCLTVDEMFALANITAPTKDDDANYFYELQWVDGDGNPVDGVYKNMNIYASFVPVPKTKARVYFLDENGDLIKKVVVDKGTYAECEDQEDYGTFEKTYLFEGWRNKEGVLISDLATYVIDRDETLTASYVLDTRPICTVKFVNYDGSVILSKLYKEGDIPSAPADPKRAGSGNKSYAFAGWDANGDGSVDEVGATPVGGAVYKAVYSETTCSSHTNTELRGQRAATTAEDGYTGDTYCRSCGGLVSVGQVIPATISDTSNITDCTIKDLGQPIAQYIPNTPVGGKYHTYGRSVWDMTKFDGKIYIGSGDFNSNSGSWNGGSRVLCYDIEQEKWVLEATVPEEAVNRFRIINGDLSFVGMDAVSNTYYANYYRRENGVWKTMNVLPTKVVHNFDLLQSSDGTVFAGLGTDYGDCNSIAISTDGGKTFKNADMRKDGRTVLDSDITSTTYCRTINIFEYKGDIYATYQISGSGATAGLYKWNKSTTDPVFDFYYYSLGNLGIDGGWSTGFTVQLNGKLAHVRNGMYVFGDDLKSATYQSAVGTATCARNIGDRVLISSYSGSGTNITNKFYITKDFSNYELICSFNYSSPVQSFTYADGYIYAGTGSTNGGSASSSTSISATTGEIFRIDANKLNYEVKFLDSNNNVVVSETVKYGESVDAPAAPTLNGYDFEGWSADTSYVTGNMTVTPIYVEGEACLHENTEIRNATAPSCTVQGYTGDTYCLNCGECVSVGNVIPATGHDYANTVTAPTCGEQGYTEHNCIKCDDSYIGEYVPATGEHVFTNYVPDGNASCGHDGTKTAVCDVCGSVTHTVTDIGSAPEHVLGEYKVTRVASENGTGEKSAVCQNCHETVTVQYSVGLYGDADGDGYVNAEDVMLLGRYLAGAEVDGMNVDAVNVHNVKIGSSKKPNQIDLTRLIRFVAGWQGYTFSPF